ncbi:MAG: hypothetical protein ABIQ49_11395 [Gemmatimonadales bacterium]
MTEHNDEAVAATEAFLNVPYYVSRAWIHIEPAFTRIRGRIRLAS